MMLKAPLPPGSRIGILGSGQLGRMLAVAASRLGLASQIYAEELGAPASQVAAASTVGDYEDEKALARFASTIAAVTCEFENVPARALEIIARSAPVMPPPSAFAVAQDRAQEKAFVAGLGIPVAPYVVVDSEESLHEGLKRTGLPSILKTRRFGYDGKGQVLIRDASDAARAYASLHGAPAVLEKIVLFDREISVIVVRGQDGKLAFYDPVENVHQNGILHTSRAPASLPAAISFKAKEIAGKIAEALAYVGVLCVEMFESDTGPTPLIVNEIAPRVHNSGHWTLDACLVSQFENHIRAIAGWPLGSTARHSDAVMTNLIGNDIDRWPELAAEESVALHLYGKKEARPGRKMGHFTRLYPKS